MSERRAWTKAVFVGVCKLYERRGIKKWADISRLLQTQFQILNKSGKQCRERYHNHLDSAIRLDKWTHEQEKRLLDLHNTLGNHWAQIARSMEGRSENCIKNQFYSILRRGLRKINKIIRLKLKRFKQLQIGLLYRVVEICELSQETSNNKMSMCSWEIKREITYFGMNETEQSEVQLNCIKKMIKNVKAISKVSDKKKQKGKDIEEEEKESQEVESSQYRDNCPVEEVKLRRSSFYSFRLQKDEDKLEGEPSEVKTLNAPTVHPFINRSSSIPSCESISPRCDVASPKCFDLFSTEGGILEYGGQTNRASPQGAITCESPYFDQYRSSIQNWYHYYQH